MDNKMNYSNLLLILGLIVAFVGCTTSDSKKSGELSAFQPRAVEEYQLSNGLQVLLIKDSALPYISYNLLIKTGSSSDSLKKSGLANLTANLLEKGTQSKSANIIAGKLGQYATDFDSSVNRDYTMFRSGSLSKFQGELLDIFSEIITTPAFPENEIKLLKGQLESILSKSADNPSAFSDRTIDQFLFEGHPYGQPVSGRLSTVGSLKRQDFVSFYDTYYRPNHAILAVVGNYDENIKKMIETRFSKWKNGHSEMLAPTEPKAIEKTQIRIVDKPEVIQTQIRIAQLGISRSHPDYLKLRIANSILGSGFSSRLVSRVRDQLGLTYHISSQVEALSTTGALEIKTFTKNESAGVTIQETISTFKDFYKNGVTGAEVEEAKSFMIGQFPQIVETAEAWAQNLLILRVYGVSDTYLTEFRSNVRNITEAEVNEAIKKHYTPEKLKILAFSTASQISDQLKSIGTVEIKNFKDYQ